MRTIGAEFSRSMSAANFFDLLEEVFLSICS